VLRASCLPGVSACSIGFADGLLMAGNLPPDIGAEGLCAMAPSLLQKIDKHMPETNLGALTAMTLHCSKKQLSFFMNGNVCLTVMHEEPELEPVTQEQLAEMSRELAQTFAQPENT
jgi:predicted regulator of Ras-like GTPase activity (Roadblock/LC7/MglB family)